MALATHIEEMAGTAAQVCTSALLASCKADIHFPETARLLSNTASSQRMVREHFELFELSASSYPVKPTRG